MLKETFRMSIHFTLNMTNRMSLKKMSNITQKLHVDIAPFSFHITERRKMAVSVNFFAGNRIPTYVTAQVCSLSSPFM